MPFVEHGDDDADHERLDVKAKWERRKAVAVSLGEVADDEYGQYAVDDGVRRFSHEPGEAPDISLRNFRSGGADKFGQKCGDPVVRGDGCGQECDEREPEQQPAECPDP